MLCVNEAKYVGDYSIHLLFNNGKDGTANLKNTIFNDKRPIFAKLQDRFNFAKFKIDHCTVIWFDDLDIAPEYLFYLVFKESRDYHDQFREWGYIV